MVLSHNQNREIEDYLLVLRISLYSITEVKRAKEGSKAVGQSTKQPSQEGPKNASFKSLHVFPKRLLVTNCEENFRTVGCAELRPQENEE